MLGRERKGKQVWKHMDTLQLRVCPFRQQMLPGLATWWNEKGMALTCWVMTFWQNGLSFEKSNTQKNETFYGNASMFTNVSFSPCLDLVLPDLSCLFSFSTWFHLEKLQRSSTVWALWICVLHPSWVPQLLGRFFLHCMSPSLSFPAIQHPSNFPNFLCPYDSLSDYQ